MPGKPNEVFKPPPNPSTANPTHLQSDVVKPQARQTQPIKSEVLKPQCVNLMIKTCHSSFEIGIANPASKGEVFKPQANPTHEERGLENPPKCKS